jgi:hypothetical protein
MVPNADPNADPDEPQLPVQLAAGETSVTMWDHQGFFFGLDSATIERIQRETGARIEKLQDTQELCVMGVRVAVKAACKVVDNMLLETLRSREAARGAGAAPQSPRPTPVPWD